ncbi:MAG: alpha-galactosidase, partial [Fervidicoccus fontis]
METYFSNELFEIQIRKKVPSLRITSPLWPTLQLEPLTCEIKINDNSYSPKEVYIEEVSTKEVPSITWMFSESTIYLVQNFIFSPKGWLHLHSELKNLSEENLTLNYISLLKLKHPKQPVFGRDQEKAKVYEDGGHWGRVRPLNQSINHKKVEPLPVTEASGTSQTCWEIYNPRDHMALLVGYTTFERWLGTVKVSYSSTAGVMEWTVGFDGGDLLIDSNQILLLEDVVLMIGQDPWRLLENFGDLIKEKYRVKSLEKPPVSWCSWYPYRLSVSEGNVLANANVAARRLKSLGLKYIKVDLGWEKSYLPSTYEENEQFPHGLNWLSKKLTEMGFNLGIWIAPFTVSELDSILYKHSEWLLGSNEEKPKPYSTWFWKPHGKVYALDLTCPEVQEYLHEKMRTLALRGVKYFKLDFTGGPCDSTLRNRHNPRIVAGGGTEAVRMGHKIIAEAIRAVDPRCIVLSCNPYEVCGVGYSDLLYTCKDTGNTGYLPWSFMRENYTSVACHLWKNRRLGVIEPSCLCVGLPGTIEEARIRATATFLSGGEVDISDDLTTLPEDRWQVLLSILPPLDKSAKPLDLFEPLPVERLSYTGMCRGLEKEWMDYFE